MLSSSSSSKPNKLSLSAFLGSNIQKPFIQRIASNPIVKAQQSSSIYDNSELSVKKEKKDAPKTIGKGWFDLQPLALDEKTKRDVRLIQMRNYIDPKRFYKNPDQGGTILHVGTVVEGPTEYKSSRLSNKERKQSIVEEVLSDQQTRSYAKRVFLDIQHQKANKRKSFKAIKKAKKAKPLRALF